ncbi:hypothetical protein A8C56_02500 [Niabella ginsenosidivorans]|uniref:Uncharacterized protein n=1 Tax=Niabella ginsenosidivorans TaxID=1176587 RepID=A0A1A9HY42_9BACT|nr:hypothetical protein A8C56_02500 [Niabella ginsenosidivorans]
MEYLIQASELVSLQTIVLTVKYVVEMIKRHMSFFNPGILGTDFILFQRLHGLQFLLILIRILHSDE